MPAKSASLREDSHVPAAFFAQVLVDTIAVCRSDRSYTVCLNGEAGANPALSRNGDGGISLQSPGTGLPPPPRKRWPLTVGALRLAVLVDWIGNHCLLPRLLRASE